MITIPVYELLLLPEVTFFFKKDMFPEGRIKEQNIGCLLYTSGICWSWKKAQRNKDQISGRDGEIRQLNSLRVYGKSVV